MPSEKMFPLTRAERLSLWLLYELLKKQSPKDEKHYSDLQEIVAQGFEIFYPQLALHIDYDTLSTEGCKFVLDVLDMYRAIETAYKSGAKPLGTMFDHFAGFDGNNETNEFAFAKFLFDVQGKFEESAKHTRNSHMQVIPTYRAMLAEYRASERAFPLTSADVARIVGASQRR